MNLKSKTWAVQIYRDGKWWDRGMPYHDRDNAVEDYEDLRERNKASRYRVISIVTYTDERVMMGGDDEQGN